MFRLALGSEEKLWGFLRIIFSEANVSGFHLGNGWTSPPIINFCLSLFQIYIQSETKCTKPVSVPRSHIYLRIGLVKEHRWSTQTTLFALTSALVHQSFQGTLSLLPSLPFFLLICFPLILLTLCLNKVNLCFCLFFSWFPYIISDPATLILCTHRKIALCLKNKKSFMADFCSS